MADFSFDSNSVSKDLTAGLQRGELESEPFPHGRVSEFLPTCLAKTLADDFPSRGFRRSEGRSGHYLLEDMDLIEDSTATEELDNLSLLWQDFAAGLNSDEYRYAMQGFTGVDLKHTTTKLRLCRYGSGHWMLPHTDKSSRVITQIIYLQPRWENGWGGALSLYRDSNVETPAIAYGPAFNSSIIIIRSDRSFHAVNPVSLRAQSWRISALFQYVGG